MFALATTSALSLPLALLRMLPRSAPSVHTKMWIRCPWVTTVGATQMNHEQSVEDPESAAALQTDWGFFSGGGFSNYHSVPDYQADTVASYFSQHPSAYTTYEYNGSRESIGAEGGRFNRHGRAFPDVSANGGKLFFVTGQCYRNDGGGTSALAPIWASIVSILNAERLKAGKSSLGFINPALYANPQLLNDITNGTNPGCGTDGFEAVQGSVPCIDRRVTSADES